MTRRNLDHDCALADAGAKVCVWLLVGITTTVALIVGAYFIGAAI